MCLRASLYSLSFGWYYSGVGFGVCCTSAGHANPRHYSLSFNSKMNLRAVHQGSTRINILLDVLVVGFLHVSSFCTFVSLALSSVAYVVQMQCWPVLDLLRSCTCCMLFYGKHREYTPMPGEALMLKQTQQRWHIMVRQIQTRGWRPVAWVVRSLCYSCARLHPCHCRW